MDKGTYYSPLTKLPLYSPHVNFRVASSVARGGYRDRGQSKRNATKSPHPPIKQTTEHSTVTLDDVKGVAYSTISDGENLSETFEGIFQ